MTIQGMRMKTEWMIEEMRRRAIDETMKQFVSAAHTYYSQGYDNGETVKLIHQLEDLGVDPEVIFDIDFAIRESHKE